MKRIDIDEVQILTASTSISDVVRYIYLFFSLCADAKHHLHSEKSTNWLKYTIKCEGGFSMSTPSKLQGKQKRYNETKNPFLALPLKDQIMEIRILHTGLLTSEEISKKLGISVGLVNEILTSHNLRPNHQLEPNDDGYKVNVSVW